MLTLFIGLFVLIASLFISSDKLSVYKFPIAGFLSVLFFGIMFTLFSTEMTLYEKIGWSLVTSLELIAVPLFLYFLIEEKSVPKIIALIIGTALVMFAQELREGELVEKNLLCIVSSEYEVDLLNLDLGKAKIEKAFDPQYSEVTELDAYYSIAFRSISKSKYEAITEYLSSFEWIEDLESDDLIQGLVPQDSDLATVLPVEPGVQLNDPLYSKQWGLQAVQLTQAFEIIDQSGFIPSRQAKVVVLDTGIKGDHEDFGSNVFTIGQNKLVDKNGHGTHCAGTIGAINNNGKGISSFNYKNAAIAVSGIQVLNDRGIGTESKIVNGIIEAVDAGADVISMSLGGLGNPLKQRAYKRAIEYAQINNVIIVSAAGNSASNAKRYLPTAIDYVFSVSALDANLKLAKFSNSVKDVSKGLAAPGVGIISTDEQGNYKEANGTSMAAPFVSGLIGLMRCIDQDLSASEAFELLETSGTITDSKGHSGVFIQADKAIRFTLDRSGY